MFRGMTGVETGTMRCTPGLLPRVALVGLAVKLGLTFGCWLVLPGLGWRLGT